MERLTEDDMKEMTDGDIVDALVKNAYDMGVAKVYLEAKNYEDDEYNVDILIKELERRIDGR
jgi:hypothetical protein